MHREIESMLIYLSMIDSLEGKQKFEVIYIKYRQLISIKHCIRR